MRQLKIKDITLIALFTALSGISAFIKIPFPIMPITMQFFFCTMAGIVLGPVKGMVSQVLYVAAGLLVMPVFTGGGGIGYVLQPSFGFLLGFCAAAFVTGWVSK